MRADRTFVLIGLTLLVTLPLALLAQTTKTPASKGSISPFIWLGADKQPLPFQLNQPRGRCSSPPRSVSQ